MRSATPHVPTGLVQGWYRWKCRNRRQSRRKNRTSRVHGGHTFGAVIRIGVVTGAVPQEQAGNAEIKLVFRDGGSQPAAALQVDGLAGRAVVSAERTDRSHIHGAVVEVTGEAEGAERGHFTRDANPPCVAFAAVAFKRGQIAPLGSTGSIPARMSSISPLASPPRLRLPTKPYMPQGVIFTPSKVNGKVRPTKSMALF